MIERGTLEHFTYYKFGGYGGLTWFPEVDFKVPAFEPENVDKMRTVAHKHLKSWWNRYNGVVSNCRVSRDLEVQKYWGQLPKFKLESPEIKGVVEEWQEYLTFDGLFTGTQTVIARFGEFGTSSPSPSDFGDESDMALSPYRYFRQIIRIAKRQGYKYVGRGSFDTWIESSHQRTIKRIEEKYEHNNR
jgi:hypothetical protein